MVTKNLNRKAAPVKAATVTNYSPSAVIKLTKLGAQGNPKHPNSGAHQLYALYKNGMTVGAYVNAAKATDRPKAGRVAIAWDVKHGYITVS
jgi:hypothetical protein